MTRASRRPSPRQALMRARWGRRPPASSLPSTASSSLRAWCAHSCRRRRRRRRCCCCRCRRCRRLLTAATVQLSAEVATATVGEIWGELERDLPGLDRADPASYGALDPLVHGLARSARESDEPTALMPRAALRSRRRAGQVDAAVDAAGRGEPLGARAARLLRRAARLRAGGAPGQPGPLVPLPPDDRRAGGGGAPGVADGHQAAPGHAPVAVPGER